MHHITFLNFKPHLYENSIEEIIHGKTRVFNNHTFGVSHILKGYKLNGYILEKNVDFRDFCPLNLNLNKWI